MAPPSLPSSLYSLLPPPPSTSFSHPTSLSSSIELYSLSLSVNNTPLPALGLRYRPRESPRDLCNLPTLPFSLVISALPPAAPGPVSFEAPAPPSPVDLAAPRAPRLPPTLSVHVSAPPSHSACAAAGGRAGGEFGLPFGGGVEEAAFLALVTGNVYESYLLHLFSLVSEGHYSLALTGLADPPDPASLPAPEPRGHAPPAYAPYAYPGVTPTPLQFLQDSLGYFASVYVFLAPAVPAEPEGWEIGGGEVELLGEGDARAGDAEAKRKGQEACFAACAAKDQCCDEGLLSCDCGVDCTPLLCLQQCLRAEGSVGATYLPTPSGFLLLPASPTVQLSPLPFPIPSPPILDPNTSNPISFLDVSLFLGILSFFLLGAAVILRKSRLINTALRLPLVDSIVSATEPDFTVPGEDGAGLYDEVGYEADQDDLSDTEQGSSLTASPAPGAAAAAAGAFGFVDSDEESEEGGKYVRMADLRMGSSPATPFGKKRPKKDGA